MATGRGLPQCRKGEHRVRLLDWQLLIDHLLGLNVTVAILETCNGDWAHDPSRSRGGRGHRPDKRIKTHVNSRDRESVKQRVWTHVGCITTVPMSDCEIDHSRWPMDNTFYVRLQNMVSVGHQPGFQKAKSSTVQYSDNAPA